MGPQADEGLADADVELGGDHAGGLVHDVLEVGARLELGGQLAGRRVGLQDEDGLGGDVGHDQGVGVLVVGERARPVAVEVEGARGGPRRPAAGSRRPPARRRRRPAR